MRDVICWALKAAQRVLTKLILIGAVAYGFVLLLDACRFSKEWEVAWACRPNGVPSTAIEWWAGGILLVGGMLCFLPTNRKPSGYGGCNIPVDGRRI